MPQLLAARIAMGLEQHQQAIELADFGSFERSANLDGMMAVVVDHRHVVDDALDVEAAADSGKFAERLANQFRGNIQVQRDGGGGGGVAHIVNARRMQQAEHAEVVALEGKAEFAIQTLEVNVADDQIRLRRNTVSDDRALYQRD